eukprot:5164409-Pleurochrysis_carterae.AAC.1
MDPIRVRRGAMARSCSASRVQLRRVRQLANVRVERRPPRGQSRPACHSPATPRPRRSGTFANAC